MNVEINMINVENGDAVILMLQDTARKSLILIDTGFKKHFHKIQRRLEEVLPLFDNKIDLLICTHYDNDHIGGVEDLLDNYHAAVQKIWIHKIDQSLSELEQKFQSEISLLESANKPTTILRILKSFQSTQNELIVEDYKQLLRVISKLKDYGLEEKIEQPVHGTFLKKFPEFKVVSPTSAYYNSNLEALKRESIKEDSKANHKSNSDLIRSFQRFLEVQLFSPCDQLETSSTANNVSAANMVSIVTLLKAGDKKYLFTGDAGIESFTIHTPGWEQDLKDLFFLDLPHHGSKNNTSKKMLDVFNPKTAFVSAKNTSGKPSLYIKQCLKSKNNNQRFEVTNENSTTWYLKFDDQGNFQRVLL